MNKKIKGYELMKLIAENQIKSGTKFKDLTDNNYADDRNIYRYENNNFIGRWGGTNILLLLKHDFEILEDEEEIDIETKLFEDIEMCIKRLSDFRLEAKPYVERYECDLEKYKTKKINKED